MFTQQLKVIWTAAIKNPIIN